MVRKIKLTAKSRDTKESPKNIRQKGFLPAVLYGSGGEAEHLEIKYHDLEKAYDIAGESSLVDLEIDKKDPVKAIIKDIQKDGVKDKFLHIDLYRVDMKNKIEVEVPLEFIGDSKAVAEMGGTLVKNMQVLQVSCLPGDLLENIKIDLSLLKDFNDSIRVSDISLPESIEVMNDGSESVVTVVEPQIYEEEEPEEQKEQEEGEAGETPKENKTEKESAQ